MAALLSVVCLFLFTAVLAGYLQNLLWAMGKCVLDHLQIETLAFPANRLFVFSPLPAISGQHKCTKCINSWRMFWKACSRTRWFVMSLQQQQNVVLSDESGDKHRTSLSLFSLHRCLGVGDGTGECPALFSPSVVTVSCPCTWSHDALAEPI